jgi:hypothetical protein
LQAAVVSPRRALILLSLVALALVAGVGVKPAAAAGKPACWRVLLNDWYDGRIDGTYPIHCYRDALKHLPSDVDTYSSAREDIQRALASARLAARRAGRKLTGNTLIQPAKNTGGPGAGSGRKKGAGLTKLANQLDPGGPSSVPVPLLVLGGLAIVLLALGGGGLVYRRVQSRKPGT